jgi:hypothetical protein
VVCRVAKRLKKQAEQSLPFRTKTPLSRGFELRGAHVRPDWFHHVPNCLGLFDLRRIQDGREAVEQTVVRRCFFRSNCITMRTGLIPTSSPFDRLYVDKSLTNLFRLVPMGYRETRSWVHGLFKVGAGGRTGGHIDHLIMGLIVLNVIAVMLETVDSLYAS